jgi:single-stranded-DNA-specific exonuclease
MDRAAQRLAEAISTGERVTVFGDYDVDGATSAATLKRYFEMAGGTLEVYVPDRLREGYGPNAAALERIAADGAQIVVTVDCGIVAHDALAAGAAVGLEVIVVDHHTAEPVLPPALAVVNPNRLDQEPGLGHLAAVGVVFLLVVALNRTLRAAGWFADGRPEPSLLSLLDLVALGTVCDVVPIRGFNRAIVAQGVKVVRQLRNPGVAALTAAAGIRERIDAYHLGYVLGPRVNAGGRVGASHLGAQLLSTNDPIEAREIAEQLDRHNQERRMIEEELTHEALEQAEGLRASDPIIIVDAED